MCAFRDQLKAKDDAEQRELIQTALPENSAEADNLPGDTCMPTKASSHPSVTA